MSIHFTLVLLTIFTFVKGEQVMYDIFEQLLQKYGVTAYKVSKETGVTQATLSNWKSGRSIPKQPSMQKIADYFGVSLDYLMTGKDSFVKEPVITPKDERDIAKDLDAIMKKIETGEDGPLHYNGQELDDDSLLLLKDAMNLALRQLKVKNKEKYNPNKNKK